TQIGSQGEHVVAAAAQRLGVEMREQFGAAVKRGGIGVANVEDSHGGPAVFSHNHAALAAACCTMRNMPSALTSGPKSPVRGVGSKYAKPRPPHSSPRKSPDSIIRPGTKSRLT